MNTSDRLLKVFLSHWETNRSPVHILFLEGAEIYAGVLVSAFARPSSLYFVVRWRALKWRASAAWTLTKDGPIPHLLFASSRLAEYDGCYIFKDGNSTVVADLKPEFHVQYGFTTKTEAEAKTIVKPMKLLRPAVLPPAPSPQIPRPQVAHAQKHEFVQWARGLAKAS